MQKNVFKHFEWILVILFLLTATWFYLGFYRVDPYLLGRFPLFSKLILYGFRLGLPILVIVGIFLYVGWRRGRIRPVNILLFGIALIVCGVLAFAAGNWMYTRQMTLGHDARLYHPYLQIGPPEIDGEKISRQGIHIFCLGGSTTEFVDKEGTGWPERVESRLRERFGTDAVQVHNLGRQWYTTLHTLINYEVNLRPLKPDVILVMHAVNDLLQNADFSYFSHGSFRDDYGHFYGPVTRIVSREGFGTFVRQLLSGLWYHRERTIVSQDSFPGLGTFKRNLNTLIDLAEKDGVRVVLMTQPNLYKETMTPEELDALYMLNYEAVGNGKEWDARTVLEGMRQYQDVLRQVAGERSVALIDSEESFPKNLDCLTDDVHYTRKGFDWMGDHVSENLLPVLSELIKERPY